MTSVPPKIRTALVVIACLFSTPLLAQQLREPPTLHEYFDVSAAEIQGKMASAAVPRLRELGSERTVSREPSGAPPLTLEGGEDEPVIDAQGMKSALPMPAPQGGLDPQTALNTMDDQTDQVDQLNYFSSFDPSVIPYKRVVAQNKVVATSGGRGGYAFVVEPGEMRPVRRDPGAQQEGEDMFWGTFLLRTRGGELTPIPSVAPGQRVVEVRLEPAGELEVFEEEAGNFYVRRAEEGLVRVTMRIAAPKAYFDGSFGPVRWQDFRPGEGTGLPEALRATALEVALGQGWSRQRAAQEVLLEMIAYFRDFESKAFSAEFKGQDLYSAIVRQKLGVCRHRSFAFVITASALGIPARYVYNEAHAFVEVLWPGLGWRRVDLGGAANDVLMRTAAAQKRVHDGGTKDDLPQPPAYLKEIERMAAQGGGGDQEVEQDEGAQRGNQGTNGGVEPKEAGGQSLAGEPGSDQEFVPTAEEEPGEALGPVGGGQESRTGTKLSVLSAPSALMRGQEFEVTGQLSGAGGGAEVKAVLMAPGTSSLSQRAIVLGQGRSSEDGGVRLRLRVPPKLAIGRWSLKLLYAGDETYAPSESE